MGRGSRSNNGIQVARLTPPGRGAIATLTLFGEGALCLLDRFFRTTSGKRLTEITTSERPVFGVFCFEPLAEDEEFIPNSDERLREEVVVRVHGPSSLEVHCHGGIAIVARIEESLASAGAQCVPWNAWAHDTASDPIRSEALETLSRARTERTASLLLAQYNGALRAAIEGILADLSAKCAATAVASIERLLALADVGLHLTMPWRIAVAGPPNAGKSSLINAMAGFERAIVHHEPGTTRDAVTVHAAFDGWPVTLIDTAGLRETEHQVERAGVTLANRLVKSADLALLVFDASRPMDDDARMLVKSLPRAIVVANKWDLVEETGGDSCDVDSIASGGTFLRTSAVTSAVTSAGMAELVRDIASRLVPQPPKTGDALPFTEEQAQALQAALERLKSDDRDGAKELLSSSPF